MMNKERLERSYNSKEEDNQYMIDERFDWEILNCEVYSKKRIENILQKVRDDLDLTEQMIFFHLVKKLVQSHRKSGFVKTREISTFHDDKC